MPTQEDIERLLNEAMPEVRAILVEYYGLIEEEAEAFQDVLRHWFRRATRRAGNRLMALEELKQQLIFVTCKYARALQIARFRGVEPVEEAFTLRLARPAEEVATEILMTSNGTQRR